jgi:Alr-MurF fusion protein
MHYSATEIAKITNGALSGNGDLICENICIDTRKKSQSRNDLFIALKGKKIDGHVFIAAAEKNGIRVFLVETLPEKINKNYCYIVCKDALKALQTLATYHREQFTIPIIGITGSNGKTIIKEWLYQLLSESKIICASPNSFNSQLGVALSVLLLKPEHEIGLFEAGISKTNEMLQLQNIIQPTIGIISNIGAAHDEGFIDRNEKLDEKLKLFDKNCQLIYCLDHKLIHDKVNQKFPKRINWTNNAALQKEANYFLNITRKDTYTLLSVGNHQLEIPFTDTTAIENCCHCVVSILSLNIPINELSQPFKSLKSLNNRLEIKKGINTNTIINDSYSNDLISLDIALQFQSQNNLLQQPKILILSDLLQSDKNKVKLYEAVAALIQRHNIQQLVGIGKAINDAAEIFTIENKIFFNDTETFLKAFNYRSWFNQSILIKGSRLFAFERIDQVLQQKAHETQLEINLNAFVHNLNYYRSLLKPKTKIMAMVKAFAYGSGNIEIAAVLQQQQVDYLAVAFADEGVELRQAGITLPIMVMNPDIQSFQQMTDYNLEPEIYSFRILNQYLKHLELLKSNNQTTDIAIHVKIDTGMHRLGFDPYEIEELIAILKKNQIKVASVFSHLAASDNVNLDGFTKEQITLFASIGDKIKIELNNDCILHLANTSGIARHPASHFDMVRLGIGLYGVANSDSEQRQLQLAGILSSIISQIKTIPAGETVGYNRNGKVKTTMRIATIPIGYADGFSRQLGNGNGHVFINGKSAPIIGNVCMDMCMANITDVACEEGDRVIIYENIEQLNGLAANSKTIPYEILTNVSARVKRVYVNL